MKKALVGAVLAVAAVRLALIAGAGEALGAWAKEISADGSLISATLSLELGGKNETQGGEPEAAITEREAPETDGVAEEFISTMLVNVTPAPEDEEAEESPEIIATTISSDVSIRNDTEIDIDIDELAAGGLALKLQTGQPQVLIIHTHASEAYAQDEFDEYVESDAFRTQDANYSVIRVGDALAEGLEKSGLTVIHDRGVYDYPSYTGSYTRSGEAVEKYLEQYPSIQIVIDLHRDAIGTGDVVYKTQAAVEGESCSQVMLLVGTGENGLAHPNWRENLKLALYMQNAMDDKYPTLARPIAMKQERYNQHLTNGSLILEVGSSGNTLKEALCAIELFADAVGPALAELLV